MKVQLFIPPGGYFAERWSKGSSMPPLGLLYIGAVLEKEGIDVEIVPADILKMSWGDIQKKIRTAKPDIVGVTSTTENRFQSFMLVKTAKEAYPKALTILGGPHASMAAEDALAHIPELDLVARGEGELTMVELCRTLERPTGPEEIGRVAGLSLRHDGRIVHAPPRLPIRDLDSLPYPGFHLVPFRKYNFTFEVPGLGPLPAINVMTSRGCPFNCNFCATPINWGRAVRMRSPENVIREIEQHVRDYGVRLVFFYDDTFNANAKRVEDICDLILGRGLEIFWKCEVRMDIMTRPLLEKMKRSGLFHLSFGLEAGSERIRNEVINKHVEIEDFRNLVRWCRELDVVANPFFIFSHPTETWEEAQETARLIEEFKDRVEASVAILHVYPGTPLEKMAKETGVLPKDFTWTRRYRSRVVTLPTAQGDVPLFIDKLSWAQVSELLFRWAMSGGKISLLKKIPRALRHIRSWAELKRYMTMAWVYAKLKAAKRAGKNRKTPGSEVR